MPFDGRTFEKPAQAKPPVRSLAGLAMWLETQPPETAYSYTDIKDCLLARYFRAKGYRWAFVGVGGFHYHPLFIFMWSRCYPGEMDEVASRGARTYGAALSRARALLASEG